MTKITALMANLPTLPTMDWDLRTFLENSTQTLGEWAGLAVALIGIVMIFVSIWMIATGLMSHGKKQTNWAVALITLLFGGVLAAAGGFNFMKGVAEGGRKTMEDLGGNVIMPNLEFIQTIMIPFM